MNKAQSTNYDILKLLALKDLNVRTLAAREPISLGRYVERLNFFVTESQVFLDIINDMTVIMSDSFFLNRLNSFYNIRGDINALFINECKRFQKILRLIGADRLKYLLDDMDKYITLPDDPATRGLATKLTEFSSTETFQGLQYGELIEQLFVIVAYNIRNMVSKIKRARSWEKHDGPDDSGDVDTLSELVEKLAENERNRKRRILMIDDMMLMLNIVTNMLKDHYEIFTLSGGAQMISFLKVCNPDLFLLDIEMPGLDGYALFKMIKEIDEYRDTPVFFLTSNARAEYLEAAKALGVSDFIRKPVDQEILLQKIEKSLNSKKNWYD